MLDNTMKLRSRRTFTSILILGVFFPLIMLSVYSNLWGIEPKTDLTNALNNATNNTTSEDGVNVGSIVSTIIGVLIFGGTVLYVLIMWFCDCKQSGWRCCKDIWRRIKCSCCKKCKKCKRARKSPQIKPSSTDIIISTKKTGTPKPDPNGLLTPRQKLPPIGTPPVIIKKQEPIPPPARTNRRLERVHSMTIIETKRRKETREHELPRYRAHEHDETMPLRPHTTKEKRRKKNVLRTMPIILKAIRRPNQDEIISMPTATRRNDDEIIVIPTSRRRRDDVNLYPESPRTVYSSDNDDVIYRYPSNYHITSPNIRLDNQQLERLYDRPEYDLPAPDIYHTPQSMHKQPPPPSYEEATNYSSHPKRRERY